MSVNTLATPSGAPNASLRPRRKPRRDWMGLLYVAPALALVLVFFLVPLGMTAWMSLHNWPLIGVPRWIGFANYKALWNDINFWNALAFTIRYTIAATIGLLLVGFALALLVEKPRPFAGFYRTAFFLPVVIGFASASLLWSWLSNVDSGLFSPLAEALGLTDGRVNLLATFAPAFWSVTAMVIWKMAGFYMVILMSGLHSIPADFTEAARIDGANALQRFRFITLPLVRRPFALALILCVSGSMLAFDQFYIILAGGPQNKTITAVYWIFSQSFVSFRLGYGAALSMVLLAILVVLSVIQLRLLGDRETAR
ncbi:MULTISPECIES: carbohydrate ABC transporter permease [unclassified Rhizobium]|uniref:carbohydrate ABC transporter permease n=1 Tax=unclassified Rhizobium TaxID=2613769 RepID=UPI001ADA08BA|nr:MULTISPECIES: sugar ABC transporter permease [unclassified Rhizobium]MBO9097674.1 sugar ABC transporter permease [Rhizobium sp. L58/93]MBO9133544.1 sugar ABC transporter permease [Rhizobium sp. B209b/85]MBO9167823.1 sugar ABC transporter permease [Rhizobium sp. L245/93]MBO9183868.1 sugar ABC transporter permease [Rhizobium sp. E27B/91]QXZ84112.1 sugar ABC transporter permease [Rhizobium sp. K1/93]